MICSKVKTLSFHLIMLILVCIFIKQQVKIEYREERSRGVIALEDLDSSRSGNQYFNGRKILIQNRNENHNQDQNHNNIKNSIPQDPNNRGRDQDTQNAIKKGPVKTARDKYNDEMSRKRKGGDGVELLAGIDPNIDYANLPHQTIQKPDKMIDSRFDKYPKLDDENSEIFLVRPENKQFLLPLIHFQEGPNNLYRLFKQTALLAYQNNQAVVFPYFHTHPRMKDEALNPFKLPVFETDYFVDLLPSADDTFNARLLSEKMGVLDSKSYSKHCNARIQTLIKCGKLNDKHVKGIAHYLRAAELQIEKELVIESIDSYSHSLPDEKCLAFVYGKDCMPDDKKWLNDYGSLVANIQRPAVLTALADEFRVQKMNSKPYLALHWRYDNDWLDMCVRNRGAFARRQNAAICKMVFGLMYDLDVEEYFIEQIKKTLDQHNMEYIYLATPPNNAALLSLIQEKFGSKVLFLEDVKRFANQTMYPGFLRNNYYSSFIEQELCFKSRFFLG